MKKFLVIGLGNFGAKVARELLDLMCEVTAIDAEKARLLDLQKHSQLVAIVADATERKFLENLDVGQFECAVVSTGKDSHASILIAMHLKELGARRLIVKANSADHAKILRKVGATEAVIPEEQAAIKLSRSLAQPNLIDYLPLAGDYHVAEVEAPAAFVGQRLMELRLRTEYLIQVLAVRQAPSQRIDFMPGGELRIGKGDVLVVLGKEHDINRLKE